MFVSRLGERERIRNENIFNMVGVTAIEDKLRETRVRWCGHLHRRPLDATLWKSDRINVNTNARRKGRHKLTS